MSLHFTIHNFYFCIAVDRVHLVFYNILCDYHNVSCQLTDGITNGQTSNGHPNSVSTSNPQVLGKICNNYFSCQLVAVIHGMYQ